MDPTVQLLWNWSVGGRPQAEARGWACAVLEAGKESDSVLLLAGNPDLDHDEQSRLIHQAVRDIGREELLDEQALMDAYEKGSVEDYLAGTIDGWTLVRRGCELYHLNDDRQDRQFWIVIADDANGHGGQEISITYPFSSGQFDDTLRKALAANGFTNAAEKT